MKGIYTIIMNPLEYDIVKTFSIYINHMVDSTSIGYIEGIKDRISTGNKLLLEVHYYPTGEIYFYHYFEESYASGELESCVSGGVNKVSFDDFATALQEVTERKDNHVENT